MRYVELFAGAGGMSMGLEAAGMHPVAHAEIEPHARAVLRQHWPATPLHGDVTQVDWAQYAGQVDLVAGGSPCQDLSVAGKRAGLAGARSGLFFELIRAWEETGAPYCLWENVDGARSSNGGEDFAAVLSAFVGATVAVPSDGWRGSGVAAGRTGVAAWRVLDLQHFGPPQRRRRVFVLAARTGGCDPAEILSLTDSVCRHSAPREQQRQRAARGAAGGAASRSGIGAFDSYNMAAAEVAATLSHGESGRPIAFNWQEGGDRNVVLALDGSEVIGSLLARADSSPCVDRGQPAVLAFHPTQTPVHGTVAPAIGATSDGMAVLAFDTTQITSAANYSNPKPGDPCHPLAAGAHPPVVLSFTPGFVARGEGPRPQQDLVQTLGANTQGDQAPHIVCLASGQANAEITSDGSPSLTALHEAPIVVGTLDFGGHGGSYNGQDAYQNRILPVAGRPRRLTPLECERLMGWPDRHTAQGVKEDGTAYALSDTARYRLCGNGVGAPVAAWIGQRLVAAHMEELHD